MRIFLRSGGFPGETGSLAQLRGLKQTLLLYITLVVRSCSRNRRLQCDKSKTLVKTSVCQIAKNARKLLSIL
jgi:hypothetical protein